MERTFTTMINCKPRDVQYRLNMNDDVRLVAINGVKIELLENRTGLIRKLKREAKVNYLQSLRGTFKSLRS